MKKIIVTVLLAALLLVSCSGGSDVSDTPKQTYNTKQLVEKITADYSLSGGSYFSSFSEVYGEYLDSDMLLSLYGDMGEVPDMDSVEEYCVYVDGTDPNLQKELGIFKTKDGTDTELFLSFMRSRITAMLENAKNYPSVDTEPLENAQFFTEGNYVFYVVVKNDAKDISNFIKDNLD